MPRRSDLRSILIVGGGPAGIGHGGEYDCAGAQACQALREEGYKLILVDNNPATVMSDGGLADVSYIEPLHWEALARIIEKERPDALLPTMGGERALQCALELQRNGVLERYAVELIGVRPQTIIEAGERGAFRRALRSIGLESVRSGTANSMAEAWTVQQTLGFPLLVRPLSGGAGHDAVARDAGQFHRLCRDGLERAPGAGLLIEEVLAGWKEFALELMRDKKDNCIVVCCIEQLNPVGIHGGDAIAVAPAQTLTDREYQAMRNAGVAVLRKAGFEGGAASVRFALNPADGRMVVLELTPRLSRNAALASKATGFPVARVAAKLAAGCTLAELHNELTGGATPAAFEPVLDYVVVRLPRFELDAFPGVEQRLGPHMKSVGEVMAVGRSFQDAFQKALRGLETGVDGLRRRATGAAVIADELALPGPELIWYVGDAFAQGCSVEQVRQLSGIDPWFLAQIRDLVEIELWLETQALANLDKPVLHKLKQQGFSDRRLATLLRVSEQAVREHRHMWSVRPVYKRIDGCAGEFATRGAGLYSSYEDECEALPQTGRKLVLLGAGASRIGQGGEFDYCGVQAAQALREDGYQTIMVNCNPAALSTDAACADRLYLAPLTLEDVLEIVMLEQPLGVIVQFGGDGAQQLAAQLEACGVTVLGTAPAMAALAEDRVHGQHLLRMLDLRQPPSRSARSEADAVLLAREIGYPLALRPGHTNGAMLIVHEQADLERYMRAAIRISHGSPVLLERFLSDAIEVEVECVADGAEVLIAGVLEHVEQAGVHAGDSACAMPPYSLAPATVAELKRQATRAALGLKVSGLMTARFAVCQEMVDGTLRDALYVLELTPRASRNVAFVSKAGGRQVAAIAARCIAGRTLAQQDLCCSEDEAAPAGCSVREAVFPFAQLAGADTILGPVMKSTGSAMGIGATFGAAYFKAQLGAGVRLPRAGLVFMRVRREDQARAVALARQLDLGGYRICASPVTAAVIEAGDIPVAKLEEDSLLAMLARHEIALVIITVDDKRGAIAASRAVRAAALKSGTPACGTMAGAEAAFDSLRQIDNCTLATLQDWQRPVSRVAPRTGRLVPQDDDLAAAAIVLPERRAARRGRAADGALLKLFVEQPFCEAGRQQELVAAVLQVIDSANGAPYVFDYLAGRQAESAQSYKTAFEQDSHLPFTPRNFRERRLRLLDQADAMVCIHTGGSEGGAFELSYHIFQGRCTPVLFLVWKQAPVEASVMRELDDVCDVTYLEFENADQLRAGVHSFFNRNTLGHEPEPVVIAMPVLPEYRALEVVCLRA